MFPRRISEVRAVNKGVATGQAQNGKHLDGQGSEGDISALNRAWPVDQIGAPARPQHAPSTAPVVPQRFAKVAKVALS